MKKLLLVVDYQKDFVDGALGFAGAELLDQPICARLEQARRDGWQIAFTFDTHAENYLTTQEGRNLPVEHCLHESDGWRLYGQTAAYCTEETRCFHKPAFGSIELCTYAAAEQFDEVELCGLVSNICVLSNAVLLKAALPEAKIVVDARLTASFDPALHEKALDVMRGIQIDVIG